MASLWRVSRSLRAIRDSHGMFRDVPRCDVLCSAFFAPRRLRATAPNPARPIGNRISVLAARRAVHLHAFTG